MKYVWNYVLMSWLLVKFYVLSFTPAQLEYTAVVDVNDYPTSLNCPEDAFINIASINTEGYCETGPCIIDNLDNEVIRGLCDNSTKCSIYRSHFSSTCLEEQRGFDLSYVCEAPISLDCNFETDLLCNWEQGIDDDFNWTRNSGKTITTDTRPDFDHTTESKDGFYMYIEASGEFRNSRAHLISKPILCKQNQCLTFWYHMFGDDIGSLSVYQKLKYRTDMTNRWKKRNVQSTKWIQARVDLNCDKEFQIVIEGKTKNDWANWYGGIAIDDIFVFEEKCDEGRKEICNFEKQDSCYLTNTFTQTEYISWNIVQSKSTEDGPAADHTIKSENGYFFHLKTVEKSGKGRLRSSSIDFSGLHCFTIWYYIIGNPANNLTLYIVSGDKTREIISARGDSAKKWKKTTVSVEIKSYDYILIEGFIEQIGSISFDDISIAEGACKDDKVYNYSCLSTNQHYTIDGCATFFLQTESLRISLHPSLTNSNNEMECIEKEDTIGRNLENACRENSLHSNCRINLEPYFLEDNTCFTYKQRILITYLCTDREESVTLTTSNNIATEEKTNTVFPGSTSEDSSSVSVASVTEPRIMRNSNDSATGLVVGLVVGTLLLVCVVVVVIVLLKRRHTTKNDPRVKIRNDFGEKDYIGSQDIALPLTANHSSRHMQNTGIYNESSKTRVHGHDGTNANTIPHEYTNVDAVRGFVNKERIPGPTYAQRQDKTLADNHMPNDDEYAIVDPTAETCFNETMINSTGTTDSYMVLDPTQTGFNRQIFSNTPVDYEFAKPVNNTNNKIDAEDQYALSEEGVYDHSGNNRHKESEVNIYNHAVDTIYDSGSHKRNEEGREDTYDHFFGQTTEDDYNISTTT